MNWLELTVLTTTEASELVSQILIDAGSAGVMIEDKNDVTINQSPEGQWDILGDEIAGRMSDDVKVTGYYPVDARLVDAIATVEQGLRFARDMNLNIPLGKLEIIRGTIDEEDWAESWKKEYKPLRLGQHIVVKPGWESFEPMPGDKIIEIDPGMAFGTGTHETTSLCVRFVEEHVKPGMDVIDVGTGTGILAIAAAHMGAKSVLAVDLDPMAVRIAQENVQINHFGGIIRTQQGDLLKAVDETADVVVANIIADVIVMMAEPVRAHIREGGMFICSGIARERKQEVIDALSKANYRDLCVVDDGEWTAIASRRD